GEPLLAPRDHRGRARGGAPRQGRDRDAARGLLPCDVRTIKRPVVRSFHRRFARECAAWVHSGGHGVLWSSPDKARLVVPRFRADDEMDLGRWAILDLGKSSYAVVRRGVLRGLVTTPVPRDALDVVRDRATRDSAHPGPRR